MWYTHIAELLDGAPYRFIIIAVEKTEPFAVAVYEIDRLNWLDLAESSAIDLLNNYQNAIKLNNLPCYGDDIMLVSAPAWRKR